MVSKHLLETEKVDSRALRHSLSLTIFSCSCQKTHFYQCSLRSNNRTPNSIDALWMWHFQFFLINDWATLPSLREKSFKAFVLCFLIFFLYFFLCFLFSHSLSLFLSFSWLCFQMLNFPLRTTRLIFFFNLASDGSSFEFQEPKIGPGHECQTVFLYLIFFPLFNISR